MKTRILVLLALVLAFALPAAQAQILFPEDAIGVSREISAVSTDVAVYVRYIGALNGIATVAVAGTNSVAFVAGGAIDTTVNPVTGGVGLCANVAGTIDLTDADCNTVGEFIDVVNSTANWLAWPGAALRTDTLNGNVANVAASDAQAGLGLNWNTPTFLAISLDFRPANYFGDGRNMDFALAGTTGSPNARINVNPMGGYQMAITEGKENITSGGVIGQWAIWGVTQTFNPKFIKAAGAVAPSISYSEIVRTIWSQVGAATTVEGNLVPFLLTAPGERVVARLTTTVNLTVPQIVLTGFAYKSHFQ
jgi:hypothetical protein